MWLHESVPWRLPFVETSADMEVIVQSTQSPPVLRPFVPVPVHTSDRSFTEGATGWPLSSRLTGAKARTDSEALFANALVPPSMRYQGETSTTWSMASTVDVETQATQRPLTPAAAATVLQSLSAPSSPE